MFYPPMCSNHAHNNDRERALPTTVNNASSLGLDPITLLFTIAVLGFLLSMVSFSFSKNWKTEDYGLGAWGKAKFAFLL